MTGLEKEIAAAAQAQGFILVGFAALRELPREEFYSRWLADGRHGEMAYLAREPERRFDPRRLDPRLRSVISLGFPYQAPAPVKLDWRREMRGANRVVCDGRRLSRPRDGAGPAGGIRHHAVAARMRLTRLYVDTGPVFEREWATEAAIGWFGKNTNLLNRTHGSYFFLAEIFTDLELGGATRALRRFLRDLPAMPRPLPDPGAGSRLRDGSRADASHT